MFRGTKLKEIRESKSLSQKQLAKKTGLSLTTIGYYEINSREPKATQLNRLADALGVKMEAFFNNYLRIERTGNEKNIIYACLNNIMQQSLCRAF